MDFHFVALALLVELRCFHAAPLILLPVSLSLSLSLWFQWICLMSPAAGLSINRHTHTHTHSHSHTNQHADSRHTHTHTHTSTGDKHNTLRSHMIQTPFKSQLQIKPYLSLQHGASSEPPQNLLRTSSELRGRVARTKRNQL